MKMHRPKLQQLQRRAGPALLQPSAAPRAGESVYKTERWKQLSKQLRKGGCCAVCGATQQQRRLYVDHIKELRDGGAAYELSNLRILCAVHHRLKTEQQRQQRQNSITSESYSPAKERSSNYGTLTLRSSK